MLRSFFLYLSRQKKLERWLLSFGVAQKAARHFVAGETLPEAMEVVQDLSSRGLLATLDHLGEEVHAVQEAAAATEDYREILEEIARRQLPCTISVKLSQLGLDISEANCRAHLRLLADCAQWTGSFVQVDMESSAHTEPTLALIAELRRSYSSLGAVIQSYLYRSEQDVRRLVEQGTRVRLCKGAYKEPPSVAYPHKADVDANFLRLMRILLESRLYHSIATHDPRMIEATCRTAREIGLPPDRFEFQMLYGIRRDWQRRLVEQGYRLRIYIPFGKQWFPYFMRRLGERPANVLFVARGLVS